MWRRCPWAARKPTQSDRAGSPTLSEDEREENKEQEVEGEGQDEEKTIACKETSRFHDEEGDGKPFRGFQDDEGLTLGKLQNEGGGAEAEAEAERRGAGEGEGREGGGEAERGGEGLGEGKRSLVLRCGR